MAKESDFRLDKALMMELLAELDQMLTAEKLVADINLYAGFIVCVVYNMRTSTTYVDAVFINGKILDMAKQIGSKHGLHRQWLNSEIQPIIMNDIKKSDMRDYKGFKSLKIKVPSEEYMLALKLYSARHEPKSDFNDSLKLAKKLKFTKRIQFLAVFKKFIKDTPLKDKNRSTHNSVYKFIDSLIEKLGGEN